MKNKPKIAFYWCASCGGCEESVVDLAEGLLDIAAQVEVVLWPVALDYKRKDVEGLTDGSILATFINGAIRTSEQREWAELLRRKSKIVVAFGSCAQAGGVIALANLFDADDLIRAAYETAATVQPNDRAVPATTCVVSGRELQLPQFGTRVQRLDEAIEVDYYLPGCPPTRKLVSSAVAALLALELPPKGSVLAPDHAMCDECRRKDSKPEKLLLRDFKRLHEVLADETTCLAAQGILCMGPVTRAGCEALCVQGNMPCTGCMGPTSRVRDFGAKALSSVAAMVDSTDEQEIARVLDQIPDPVGTFYRYSLAGSYLQSKRPTERSGARGDTHA